MKRSFDEIMDSLLSTIFGYDYFVDFEKVKKNVSNKKINHSLNQLNTLIGSDNFDEDFIHLINEDETTLYAIPILLALRDYNVEVFEGEIKDFDFTKKNNSSEDYLRFVIKTGLKDLLTSGLISNLKDYLVGIEVGLDSNARKNRGGQYNEIFVENIIRAQTQGQYLVQATKQCIYEKYGFDEILSLNLTEAGKTADKRFDFAFKLGDIVYLVETNFYKSGGSKLNETARSYEKLADDINKTEHFRFIWITDGQGWLSAHNALNESYTHQIYLFTLTDLINHTLIELLNDN